MFAFTGAEGPSLADGYGHWPTREAAALLSRVDDAAAVADAGYSDLDIAQFQRRHRTGKTGVALYLAGTGLAGVGTITLLSGIYTSDALIVAGAGMMFVGGIGAVVGEVMMFSGGIGAANTLRIDNTIGWVGVGFAIASPVLQFIAPGFALISPGASIAMSLSSFGLGVGAIVCGAVQLGQDGAAGRRAGLISTWTVVPTSNGVALAGRF